MIRLDEISTGLREVQDRITQTKHQQSVTLVVVTKTFPVEDIQSLYDLGVRDFGENRIEELELKAPVLPKDVRWHFLGQIQGKKIRRICQYAHRRSIFEKYFRPANLSKIMNGLGNGYRSVMVTALS